MVGAALDVPSLLALAQRVCCAGPEDAEPPVSLDTRRAARTLRASWLRRRSA
jgi:hypothetical protein